MPTRILLPFRRCRSLFGSGYRRLCSYLEVWGTHQLRRGCPHALGWIGWIEREHWCRWSCGWFSIHVEGSRISWWLGTLWLHHCVRSQTFRGFGKIIQLQVTKLISSSFFSGVSASSAPSLTDRDLLLLSRSTIPWNVSSALFHS